MRLGLLRQLRGGGAALAAARPTAVANSPASSRRRSPSAGSTLTATVRPSAVRNTPGPGPTPAGSSTDVFVASNAVARGIPYRLERERHERRVQRQIVPAADRRRRRTGRLTTDDRAPRGPFEAAPAHPSRTCAITDHPSAPRATCARTPCPRFAASAPNGRKIGWRRSVADERHLRHLFRRGQGRLPVGHRSTAPMDRRLARRPRRARPLPRTWDASVSRLRRSTLRVDSSAIAGCAISPPPTSPKGVRPSTDSTSSWPSSPRALRGHATDTSRPARRQPRRAPSPRPLRRASMSRVVCRQAVQDRRSTPTARPSQGRAMRWARSRQRPPQPIVGRGDSAAVNRDAKPPVPIDRCRHCGSRRRPLGSTDTAVTARLASSAASILTSTSHPAAGPLRRRSSQPDCCRSVTMTSWPPAPAAISTALSKSGRYLVAPNPGGPARARHARHFAVGAANTSAAIVERDQRDRSPRAASSIAAAPVARAVRTVPRRPCCRNDRARRCAQAPGTAPAR